MAREPEKAQMELLQIDLKLVALRVDDVEILEIAERFHTQQ